MDNGYKMRVLITGASGFIGSNLLKYLLKNTDWEFTCICSFRHKGSPLNISLDERVMIYSMDLTGNIPDIGDFDYILHLASESHVDRSIQDPVNFIENNVSITLQTLEYTRTHPPRRFIMFSTDEVYGAHDHKDYDIYVPTNPYSASKVAQENIAIAYFNTYDIPVIITNSNNIIGPNQDKEKFIPKIIDKITKDEIIEVHAINGEFGERYYNPVDNIGSALVFILGLDYKPEMSDLPPRYSLTGGENLNNLQMAQLIAEILGKTLHYRVIDPKQLRPTYDNKYTESQDNKLALLGWKPPLTLKQGLAWIK